MKHNNKGLIFIGLLLIAAALFLTAYNLREDMRAKESVIKTVIRLEELFPETEVAEKSVLPEEAIPSGEIETPDYILNPDMEMPVETIDEQDYIGVLAIPGLELELPIISEWSYPRLKIAPCRYGGSAYTGDLIIAAHNYSSHFGKLKDLHAGDTLTFTDIDGNVFHYEVVELDTLKPTSIEEMESGDWDLTLFTCTIGGQSRVTVRCELVEK